MANDEVSLAGLPFDALIAAPLISAAKASASLAKTTSDFILSLASEPPLTFTFQRHREVPDEANGGSFVVSEDVALSLPVLGAVSVPNLHITSINIAFNLEMRTLEKVDETSGPDDSPVLHGMPSAHREHTRASDTFAKYTFDIRAEHAGTPEALARVLDIFAQSIAPLVADSAAPPTAQPIELNDGLEALTVRELRAQIDEMNETRSAETRLRKSGTKDALITSIRQARAVR